MDTERARAASALATSDVVPRVLELVDEAIDRDSPRPATSLVVALALATDTLLSAEAIGELEADWQLIETDVAAAVEVRQMLARRRRWALDFERMWGLFRRQLIGVVQRFNQRAVRQHA